MVGVGATLVAPVLLPILRPLAKSMIKAGLVAYDQGRAALAEANEWTSDMITEVRADMAQSAEQQDLAPTADEPKVKTRPRRPRRAAKPKAAPPAPSEPQRAASGSRTAVNAATQIRCKPRSSGPISKAGHVRESSNQP